MSSYNEKFNKCHSKLDVDFNVNTPWHKYFIDKAYEVIAKDGKKLANQ